MPSGTQSNQIALRTHLVQPPYSIVCDRRAHIFKFVGWLLVCWPVLTIQLSRYEAGGAAFHSNAHVIPVSPANGKRIYFHHWSRQSSWKNLSAHHLTLEEIQENIVLGNDVHLWAAHTSYWIQYRRCFWSYPERRPRLSHSRIPLTGLYFLRMKSSKFAIMRILWVWKPTWMVLVSGMYQSRLGRVSRNSASHLIQSASALARV